jgi:hypothetical protein
MAVYQGAAYCPACTSFAPTAPVVVLADEPPADDDDLDDMTILLAWARRTLVSAPEPCTCTRYDICHRCLVQAIVNERG